MSVNPHDQSFAPGNLPTGRVIIRATEASPYLICECGQQMNAMWNENFTGSYLACPNPKCAHHGKRFAIPTVELKELPAEEKS